MQTLNCQMRDDCPRPVESIDEKGFVYCLAHGTIRRNSMRCRKLEPFEVMRLMNGQTISYKLKRAHEYTRENTGVLK